jgi:hypothetical protein
LIQTDGFTSDGRSFDLTAGRIGLGSGVFIPITYLFLFWFPAADDIRKGIQVERP